MARQTTSWRTLRRTMPDVKWEIMYCAALREGVYVKFLVGEFKDSYGWVIDQRFTGEHWMVAVSDRQPKLGGLYQWFKVTDVWLASHCDTIDSDQP